MSQGKINISKLDQLLRSGKNQRQCAQVFGVTESAVSKAKKSLKKNIIRTGSLEKAHDIVENHLDMAGQLRKINGAINTELDKTRETASKAKGDDLKNLQEIIIKMSAEVRQQLALQLRIFETWHDLKLFAEFQAEVLRILDQMQPGVRDEAIRKLQEARALRGLAGLN